MKIHAYSAPLFCRVNTNNNCQKTSNLYTQNTFELPSVSFKSAQSKINISGKEQELKAKYFSLTPEGETIFFNLEGDDLKKVCEELKSTPYLLKHAFLKNDQENNLPAHRYLFDELKIMKEELESVEGGKETLKTIFNHANDSRELPAHSFIDPEELLLMAEIVGKKTNLLAKILTTKDNKNNYPANYYDSELLEPMVNLMSDNKKVLLDILTHKDEKNNITPLQNLNSDSLKKVFEIFKNDRETIQKITSIIIKSKDKN